MNPKPRDSIFNIILPTIQNLSAIPVGISVIKAGLEQTEYLIILYGSAYQPYSTWTPWIFSERQEMIHSGLHEQENNRIHITPLMDIVCNDEFWVRNVQANDLDLKQTKVHVNTVLQIENSRVDIQVYGQ